MATMTMQRRATDHGEPTNAAILARLEHIESKLEAFETEHRKDHTELQRHLAALQSGALLREHRLTNLEANTPELATLHDFRIQVQALGRITQFLVGSSLLAALAAVASIVMVLFHLGGN